jgi:hypothetical protein
MTQVPVLYLDLAYGTLANGWYNIINPDAVLFTHFFNNKGRRQKVIKAFEKSYNKIRNTYSYTSTPPTCSIYKIGFYFFYHVGFENIQETNNGLVSLRNGFSYEVSFDILLHLKKVRGGWALPRADIQKPYAPKCGQ